MKLRKHLTSPFAWVVVIVFLTLPSSVISQRFAAGMVGGLNASQVDGDMLAGFDKLGLTAGLRATMDLESVIDLNVEFLFTQRGSRPDIFNPEFDPDIEIHLNYIELPVYLSLGDWWQKEDEYFKVAAHAGLSIGRLINGRTVDQFHPSEESLDNLVPYFSDMDLSWLAGVTYNMSKHWGITGRYTREIIPLLSPRKQDLPYAPRLLSYYLTFRLEYYF